MKDQAFDDDKRAGLARWVSATPRHGSGRGALAAAALSAALLWPAAAWAGPVASLSADARTTVANDEMVVVMSVDREGPQVAPLNETVLKELNAAIAQARRASSVKAKLSSLYTNPTYNNQGKPSGYRVNGRIELVSTDFASLSALAGDLAQKLNFGGVTFRLTAERRAQEEQALMKTAAEAFRVKALTAAQAFDFKNYEIKTLAVGTQHQSPPVPRVQAMAMAVAESRKSTPVPEEGGESEVVVTITGEVEFR